MTTTKIVTCAARCSSPFQDQYYGLGRRVYNVKPKKEKASCTVCGATITVLTQKHHGKPKR